MEGKKEELFSSKVRAGRRTYYFDVKETTNKIKYVAISEAKTKDDGGLDRFRIMVFPEDLQKFKVALEDVIQYLEENPQQ